MPIIEAEVWKPNPARPGTIIFDSYRIAQDIFNELETHLKNEGRMPDEYFLLDRKWREGAVFPREADIISNVNFGGSEGIYLDISLQYEKNVYEYNSETKSTNWHKRSVVENFATGKTLGDTIEDLDRMNLVASSVTSAFYSNKREVQERYAQIESGEIERIYPRELNNQKAAEIIPTAKTIFGDVQSGDWVIAAGGDEYRYLLGTVTAIDKLGSPEHDTENTTDDVHVDFTAFDYPPERIAEIEKHFSELYGEPKTFDELPLDNVIMSPKSLIRISNLDHDEIIRIGNNLQNCEAFCKCFPGGGEPQNAKHAELIERINKNFYDYHDMLKGFGKQEIIEMADKISATANARLYMIANEFDDSELDFYLKFQNPLEVAADVYCEHYMDIEDVGFALNFIYGKQEVLDAYPLMNDIEISAETNLKHDETDVSTAMAEKAEQAAAQTDLNSFIDVDVLGFLGRISDIVMPNDPDMESWNHLKESLMKVTAKEGFENRRIIWHISGETSRLRNECEIFVKGSRASEYEAESQDFDKNTLVYAIEFRKREGMTIYGNVFEAGNFSEHAERVRNMALPLDSVTINYSDAWGEYKGKKVTVSPGLFADDRAKFMEQGGNILSLSFNPKDEQALIEILNQERAVRMTYPIESTEAHLKKLSAMFDDAPNTTEKSREIAVKPKTLEEKLSAAKEKVKEQDTQGDNNIKNKKHEERN